MSKQNFLYIHHIRPSPFGPRWPSAPGRLDHQESIDEPAPGVQRREIDPCENPARENELLDLVAALQLRYLHKGRNHATGLINSGCLEIFLGGRWMVAHWLTPNTFCPQMSPCKLPCYLPSTTTSSVRWHSGSTFPQIEPGFLLNCLMSGGFGNVTDFETISVSRGKLWKEKADVARNCSVLPNSKQLSDRSL